MGRAYVYKTRSDKGKKRRKRISLLGKDPAFIKGYLAEKRKRRK